MVWMIRFFLIFLVFSPTFVWAAYTCEMDVNANENCGGSVTIPGAFQNCQREYNDYCRSTPECRAVANIDNVCDHMDRVADYCACAAQGTSTTVTECIDQYRSGCGGNNTKANTPSGFPRQSELTSAEQACDTQSSPLEEACNPSRNSWALSAKQTANALNIAVGAYSASKPEFACGKLGEITKNLQIASTAYSTGCTGVIASCRSNCGQALQLANEKASWCNREHPQDNQCMGNDDPVVWSGRYRSCGSYEAEANSAMQGAQGYAVSTAANANCDKQVNNEDYCQSHPNDNICKSSVVDCAAHPTEQSCICKANPKDPSCPGNNVLGKGNINNLNAASRSTRGNDLNDQQKKLMDALDAISQQSSIDPVTGGPAGGVNAIPEGRGKGAPGSLGGGGGGPGGGKGGGGQGASRFNTNVIGKLSGGAGGGGGSRGPGDPNDPSKPGANGRPGLKPGFDLKAYLPGGRLDPRRGLAGESGPDGITGANGLTLWEKVSRRYAVKRGSLISDN